MEAQERGLFRGLFTCRTKHSGSRVERPGVFRETTEAGSGHRHWQLRSLPSTKGSFPRQICNPLGTPPHH